MFDGEWWWWFTMKKIHLKQTLGILTMLYCNPHTTGQYDTHLSPTYPATLTILNFFCSSFSQTIHHLSLQIAPPKSHVAIYPNTTPFFEIIFLLCWNPTTRHPVTNLQVKKIPVYRISVGNLLIAFSGNVDGTTPFRGADCGICAAGQEQEPEKQGSWTPKKTRSDPQVSYFYTYGGFKPSNGFWKNHKKWREDVGSHGIGYKENLPFGIGKPSILTLRYTWVTFKRNQQGSALKGLRV